MNRTLQEHSAPSQLVEPALLGPLSREDDGPFGRGLLLSDLGGLARVTAVDNGDVAASVFASVLNATAVLDVDHGAGNDGRLFHFLKLSGVYEFYALDKKGLVSQIPFLDKYTTVPIRTLCILWSLLLLNASTICP